MRELDEEALQLITRLVGLIQVPQSSWTAEDSKFFRDVRDMIQRRRSNGAASSREPLEREIEDRYNSDCGG